MTSYYNALGRHDADVARGLYKEVITDVSGPTIRFVYVGRASATEPWLIVSIGTGP